MSEEVELSPAQLQVGPGFTEPATPEGLADLTPREWQVLSRRASTGEGVLAIAHHLGCSQSTVLWHQQCAREKLGMKTTWQLVAWMLRRGHLTFHTKELPPGLEIDGKDSAQVLDLTSRRRT
ncbi:helix-turn-helix transcriptional regulator [Pyruvatibacter sp.]